MHLQGAGNQESDQIIFAVGEWPPYVSKTLKGGGLLSEIVHSAMSTQNINTSFQYFPWARSYDYLLNRNDTYVGSLGYVWSADRENQMYYSQPIYSAEACFFHLKDVPFEWRDYEDLVNFKIGLTKGYYYGDGFNQANQKFKFTTYEVKSDIVNFKMLLSGRIDIFPSNKDVGFYTLKNNFSAEDVKKIKCHKRPYHEDYLYAIFPRNSDRSPYLLESLNTGLFKIRSSGDYRKIVEGFSEKLTEDEY